MSCVNIQIYSSLVLPNLFYSNRNIFQRKINSLKKDAKSEKTVILLNVVIVTTVAIRRISNSIYLLSTSYMPGTGPLSACKILLTHQSNPMRRIVSSHLKKRWNRGLREQINDPRAQKANNRQNQNSNLGLFDFKTLALKKKNKKLWHFNFYTYFPNLLGHKNFLHRHSHRSSIHGIHSRKCYYRVITLVKLSWFLLRRNY